jgi:hypothetical protein
MLWALRVHQPGLYTAESCAQSRLASWCWQAGAIFRRSNVSGRCKQGSTHARPARTVQHYRNESALH